MTMLKGKVALVTGSTSGIGLGIARALAGQGADIVLNGFGDKGEIDKIRKGLTDDFKVKAIYSAADMSNPDDIYAMVKQAQTELGSLDILVNNAGIQYVAPIQDFPIDKWNAIIAINLSASFHTVRAALPGMLKKNWGRIINIASAHGLVASVQKVAYIAAKHGLVGLTKVVALETATTGITCNAICPGWTLTPLIQSQIETRAKTMNTSVDEGRRNLLAEKQPSLEFVTTEQLGATAVFLCSAGAEQIRGIALSVDGGWTAQ